MNTFSSRRWLAATGLVLIGTAAVALGVARFVGAQDPPAAGGAAIIEPKTEALTKFVKPVNPGGDVKAKADYEAHIKKHGPNKSPAASPKMVSRGAEKSAFSGSGPYWGIGEFYYYTNDGAQSRQGNGTYSDESGRSCGQAAAATILRYWKAIPDDRSNAPVRKLWDQYPADGYLGSAGTSWQRIQSMLKDKGLSTAIIQGENDLKSYVSRGIPVIVMVDVGKFPEWKQWGGHWVVVQGYTRDRIYLTNWAGTNSTDWGHFRQGWINNPMVLGGGFRERGMVAQGRNGHL